MTLSPGDAWGGKHLLPADAPVVASDAALASLIGEQVGAISASELPIVGLAGGDLCASLGGRGDVARRLGDQATVVLVDLGRVITPRATQIFAAHVFARGRLWAGEGAAVMNAERRGNWVVAPRAHPGDGLLDIVQGELTPHDRLLARSRIRTGDHLPHPRLTTQRTNRLELVFTRPRQLVIDGEHQGATDELTVEVIPGAIRVAV